VLPAYLVGKSKVTHVLGTNFGRFRSLAKRNPSSIDMQRYYYRNNLYFRLYYYSFGRAVLFVGKCLYEAMLALGSGSYQVRRIVAIVRGLLSGLFLVMRGKPGPSPRLSSDQEPPPLWIQRKPVSDRHPDG
jgi:hypothetical protein